MQSSAVGTPHNRRQFSCFQRQECNPLLFLWKILLFCHPFLFLSNGTCHAAAIPVEGRHSFSLTTFDPNGKLGQVEGALAAASLGTPIVGAIVNRTILLASPQILPSPLMCDDGTSRFAVVSPQIVVGHTGIAADGRVVVEAAQRLAIEHSYTFDEPIPIDLFLEEMSLLFQEYTMKQGARPFGCTLVVGYLPPPSSTSNPEPRLFRIECSGAVEELRSICIVNGKFKGDGLKSKLLDMVNTRTGSETKEQGTMRMQQNRRILSQILREALDEMTTPLTGRDTRDSKNTPAEDGQSIPKFLLPMRIISASFDMEDGLVVVRSSGETATSKLTEE